MRLCLVECLTNLLNRARAGRDSTDAFRSAWRDGCAPGAGPTVTPTHDLCGRIPQNVPGRRRNAPLYARRSVLGLVGLLLTLSVAALAPASAAAAPRLYGPYEIHARHSGKCLDVANMSMAHGADVIQENCSGKSNQQWWLRANPNGHFYEVVSVNSGMCLDVANKSTAHAANVIQAKCWGGENQQWRLVALITDGAVDGPENKIPQGAVNYRLKARHSGGCLDVAHGSIAHAADVIQARCWPPGYNQQWTLHWPPQ